MIITYCISILIIVYDISKFSYLCCTIFSNIHISCNENKMCMCRLSLTLSVAFYNLYKYDMFNLWILSLRIKKGIRFFWFLNLYLIIVMSVKKEAGFQHTQLWHDASWVENLPQSLIIFRYWITYIYSQNKNHKKGKKMYPFARKKIYLL